MTLLTSIDHKPGLRKDGKTITRQAVRAIILDGRRLLMVYSTRNRDYKFPGGGIAPGETPAEALAREVLEECGAVMMGPVTLFGQVIENDLPLEPDCDLFQMTSTYYHCQVQPTLGPQRLDDYEHELGFRPAWVEIDAAIHNNRALLRQPPPGLPRWVRRDTAVLELLRAEILPANAGQEEDQ